MRLCKPVPLCLAAAAALLAVPATAGAADGGGPRCAGADNGAFPLTTRLHGGPGTYRAGGRPGTWYLDLTNTTRGTCTGIHPVVVLVDEQRALKPSQPRLEFYAAGRAHPVRFEPTDEDELVGAFADDPQGSAGGFSGFTVGPGRTLTVRLRLALTSDTPPDEITVNAAVVQRHGDDGDWVGQSNDYRFAVRTEPEPETEPGTEPEHEREAAPDPDPETDAETDAATDPESGRTPETAPETIPDADSGSDPAPATSAAASPPPGRTSAPAEKPGVQAVGTPGPAESTDVTGTIEELASTGPLSAAALVVGATLLLAAGAVLARARRRP
ncbi:hypothetical protein JCM4814A_69670 [Streptomyces phaeofaciens JCM 4814]|uniref:Gram-positive cocci surface proteins LPxTG domain-containing protein n=1 Tax=Streptomyces phaeofaciens TaxID=68254 RepID=A0A918H799_9ACTN|nr:hypothetical protein [Streptomyces phaeofaciens]GGT42056.1 hypothetical protein GCM10010226_18320 [Streptomyces phaeofaciens]